MGGEGWARQGVGGAGDRQPTRGGRWANKPSGVSNEQEARAALKKGGDYQGGCSLGSRARVKIPAARYQLPPCLTLAAVYHWNHAHTGRRREKKPVGALEIPAGKTRGLNR